MPALQLFLIGAPRSGKTAVFEALTNTPEGRDFVRTAKDEGVKAAVTRRDGPFGDYSQAPADEQPRRRSALW